MAKPYFTLLSREDKASPWIIEFGDRDRSVILSELEYLYGGGRFKKSNLKIIETGPKQPDITRAVSEMNGRAR